MSHTSFLLLFSILDLRAVSTFCRKISHSLATNDGHGTSANEAVQIHSNNRRLNDMNRLLWTDPRAFPSNPALFSNVNNRNAYKALIYINTLNAYIRRCVCKPLDAMNDKRMSAVTLKQLQIKMVTRLIHGLKDGSNNA